MNSIVCGDCVQVMAGMPENHFDAIVTDPPYGLEFMGKEWDKLNYHFSPAAKGDYPKSRNTRGMKYGEADNSKAQQWHYAWAVEALRVAKPGCHLLAFGGTRTFHRLTCAIEDAGWEIRDCLMWVYGSGFPKSHNLKGEWQGWGTALKPAWEPIILARKPLEGTVAENAQKWGTGVINVDGCRVGMDGGTTRTDGSNAGKPRNTLHGGNFGVSEIGKGRWPANLIHDGSEEVVGLFPNALSRGTYTNSLNKPGTPKQLFGSEIGINDRNNKYAGDSGSAARFFYVAKASRAEREMGLEGMEVKHVTCRPLSDNEDDRTIQERLHGRKAKNHHPTVKPLTLMRYLCRLITPPNGLILDPFMGSGTTGMAAKQEGFQFLGIDNNLEYCEIAEKRIAPTKYQGEFGDMVNKEEK